MRRAQKQGVRPFVFHATRHSYATLAIEDGRSIRWVAEQLGHADPAMTLRAYAHVLPLEDEDLSFADFVPVTPPDGPIRPLPREAVTASSSPSPKTESQRPVAWSGRSDSNRRPSAPTAESEIANTAIHSITYRSAGCV